MSSEKLTIIAEHLGQDGWHISYRDSNGIFAYPAEQKLEFVHKIDYQQALEKIAVLEAEVNDTCCILAGAEEQAQKNSAYDDWRVETLTKDRDTLRAENTLLREGLTKAKIYALNPDETVNYNEVAKVIDETLTKSCAIGKG